MDKFTLEEMSLWAAPCSKDLYSKFKKWTKEVQITELSFEDLLASPAVPSLRDITYFTLNKPSIVTGSFKTPCIFILKDVCDEFPHPALIDFCSSLTKENYSIKLLRDLDVLMKVMDEDRRQFFAFLDYMMDGNFSFDVLAYLAESANYFCKESRHFKYKQMVLDYLNVKN